MSWHKNCARCRGTRQLGLSFLELFRIPDSLGGDWLENRLGGLPSPQSAETIPTVFNLESGSVAFLEGWDDEDVPRFPLGWDSEGRFLVLEKSQDGLAVRFLSTNGVEISRTDIPLKDAAWLHTPLVSAGMQRDRISLLTLVPQGYLQALYDLTTGTLTESVGDRDEGDIGPGTDLSFRFVIDPPDPDVALYRPVVRWSGQGGVDESVTLMSRKDVQSTVALHAVTPGGERALLGRLEPGKTRLSVDYRVIEDGRALVARVAYEAQDRRGYPEVVRRKLVRVDVVGGRLIERELPDDARGFMVSPSGARVVTFGVKRVTGSADNTRASRVPWIATYATSDLHPMEQLEWPERDNSNALTYWSPGAGDWLTETEIIMADNDTIARISLATGEWRETSVADLIAKGTR